MFIKVVIERVYGNYTQYKDFMHKYQLMTEVLQRPSSCADLYNLAIL